MSATDELRRMLDEAGVEWHDDGYATTCTAWSSNGITWYGLWRDGSIELLAHHLTTEQAIAATVGCGTCHVMTIGEFNGEGTEYYDVCSNCGYEFDDDPLNYCPNCGRKVVDG